jgi:Cellobiose phosphorylase
MYSHDTGECWNPNFYPLNIELDSFNCTHAIGWTELKSIYKEVENTIKVYVPLNACREVWIHKIKNLSEKVQELSLFSLFSFQNEGNGGNRCMYNKNEGLVSNYGFPRHLRYDEKEKLEGVHTNFVYMFSNIDPTSYDCSERRFFGSDNTGLIPQAVSAGICFNSESAGENPAGIFQHKFTLGPNDEIEFFIATGCVNNLAQAKEVKQQLVQRGVINKELEEVDRYWDSVCNHFTIETPDQNLNYFMNYWLKKQIEMLTKCNRISESCPIRNQLQDVMGYALIHGEEALQRVEMLFKRQLTSGFVPQWYNIHGGESIHSAMLYKDAPVWLVLCTCKIVQQTGDLSFLDRMVEFLDSNEKVPIYEHLLKAVYFLGSDIGQHGLCLMGDGDWTDPINGPGRLGRGESTWTTVSLKYAIQQLIPLCLLKNDKETVNKLEQLAEKLDQAVNNNCWDGEWYIAGFNDDAIPFGKSSDKEGRIFLNTQTWAIISQTARGERLEKCKATINSLNTPAGPVLLQPAFSDWDPVWGRISIKLCGTTENGSVYCHASMFKAFADCVTGSGSNAYDTIMRTLPTNPYNPPEKNLQVPIFIPNYYYGLTDSSSFGQSSMFNSTGTVAWMLITVLEQLLGIKATVDGLKVQPCIPAAWREIKIQRSFKDAVYNITIYNTNSVKTDVCKIVVNGVEAAEAILPYKIGETYTVLVNM